MRITVDVHSDTVCPWCYIGKRRLETALAGPEGGIEAEVRWHPFQLNPDMPPEGIDRGRYLALKFGGEERARQVYSHVASVAEAAGLDIDLDRIRRTPNTLLSHRLLAHAVREGRQGELAEALFRAYFADGLDIGSKDVLLDAAERAGLDRPRAARHLDSDADLAEVVEEDRSARRAGLQGVPHFVFDGTLALSGAQEPEVFRQVLAVARARREEARAT